MVIHGQEKPLPLWLKGFINSEMAKQARARIGRKIRLWREHRGLSSVHLAKICGVSYQALWRWEKGRRPVDVDALEAIADACGAISIAQLIGEEPPGKMQASRDRLNAAIERVKADD